jgi:hypothetical protein
MSPFHSAAFGPDENAAVVDAPFLVGGSPTSAALVALPPTATVKSSKANTYMPRFVELTLALR